MLNKEPQSKLMIEVDILSSYDIPEVARLYEEAFSSHFLGHMGQGFLELFCAQFMNSATNYGYVAKYHGRPVGFVFGSIDEKPFEQFYRRNFWKLVILVAGRYVKDDYVRKHIGKRFRCILDAVKSLAFRQSGEPHEKMNSLTAARILAIGVDPNYRGIGIANQLTLNFCVQMKQEGFKEVGLSTLPWNERAIRFYRKDGWILEERNSSSLSFTRTII